MTPGDWVLAALIIVATMYIGDAINACTAAVRELLEFLRGYRD